MSVDGALKQKREAVERTIADLKKDEQAVIKTGEAMLNMQHLDAWKFYAKILESMLDYKRREGEGEPLAGEDGQRYALRMERIKGTIIGIRLALEQPGIMIAVGNETRKRLLGTKEAPET